MSRRNRRSSLQSNPFVVLSDMTIGLAFFFAIFSMVAGLANSQAVMVIQRQGRQESVKSSVLTAFQQVFPGCKGINKKSDDTHEHMTIYSSSGDIIGQVWENGNFQRIKVLARSFDGSRDSSLNTIGYRLYRSLGSVIKENAPSFAYLFVHGIVEPSEYSSPSMKGSARLLSRQRADNVYDLLTTNGVISSSDQEAKRNQIPAKYAIPYGTGTDLYTVDEAEQWGTGRYLGRVDIVFFYTDEREEDIASK